MSCITGVLPKCPLHVLTETTPEKNGPENPGVSRIRDHYKIHIHLFFIKKDTTTEKKPFKH